MYTVTMRYLGLAAVTVLFVFILASNAHGDGTITVNVQPPAAPSAPAWSPIHAKVFPGCVGSGDFIPTHIVVVPRKGQARTVPYNDATVARIDATWDNDNSADDLYTIGKCR